MTNIDRRTAVKSLGLILGASAISSCVPQAQRQFLEKMYQREQNLKLIYNELSKHVHLAKINGVFESENGKLIPRNLEGNGIIYKEHFLTAAHITDPNQITRQYPPMMRPMQIYGHMTDKEVKLNGENLNFVFADPENDVAIYKLPKGLELPDFPCSPKTDIKIGEQVYIIGCPFLTGTNIREGRISRLEDIEELPLTKNSFCVDKIFLEGDSGTPVVNQDCELLGLSIISWYGLGFVKKIDQYLLHLK